MKCVERMGTPKDFWPMAVASFLSTLAVAVICIVQLLIDPAVVGTYHRESYSYICDVSKNAMSEYDYSN